MNKKFKFLLFSDLSIGIFYFCIFFLIIGTIVTCAIGPARPTDQFKQLDVAADLRISILTQAGQYYKMGILTEDQKNDILKADVVVQEAGKIATSRLKILISLERLQAMDPNAVTQEQLKEAQLAYEQAKADLRAKWSGLLMIVDPWLIEWMQKASEGGTNG